MIRILFFRLKKSKNQFEAILSDVTYEKPTSNIDLLLWILKIFCLNFYKKSVKHIDYNTSRIFLKSYDEQVVEYLNYVEKREVGVGIDLNHYKFNAQSFIIIVFYSLLFTKYNNLQKKHLITGLLNFSKIQSISLQEQVYIYANFCSYKREINVFFYLLYRFFNDQIITVKLPSANPLIQHYSYSVSKLLYYTESFQLECIQTLKKSRHFICEKHIKVDNYEIYQNKEYLKEETLVIDYLYISTGLVTRDEPDFIEVYENLKLKEKELLHELKKVISKGAKIVVSLHPREYDFFKESRVYFMSFIGNVEISVENSYSLSNRSRVIIGVQSTFLNNIRNVYPDRVITYKDFSKGKRL